MPPSLNAPSRGLCHVLSNSGFFDFSHCRVFPLEYRLPARFDTIPSRPSSQALANTRSLGYQGVAEQDAVDAGDEGRKRGSPLLDRPPTEILAVEVQEIERDEAGPR